MPLFPSRMPLFPPAGIPVNAAGFHFAASAPGTAVALDTHALLLPLYDEGQLRHHHCSDVLKLPREEGGRGGGAGGAPPPHPAGQAARTMGRVFSGCLASAHALLNQLCPRGGA